ncbi:hypothetical protein GRI44_03125 [Altererythrobacter confluentis]|uniref:Abasic site processing protein n=1 Tax=Allopontixanthobacter confluentis TaxID=1849021 RepID=A0A6L7GCW3_9SPHN|nr:SOS response-associated peptidase family protein [Allopontixanthobacter confluentis]MXP13747.1 hypothetical protein [Allopontixanthobacter confluentis]
MCNLYRMTRNADEVAKLFGAVNDTAGSNLGAEVYPGYPGMVIENGRLRVMNWGFPLQRKGARGQPLKPKPVNNARTDKLSGFFWKSSFEKRRCLIPLTSWAEAEGPKGAMTRSWMGLPEQSVFACAGIWRGSDEWGDVYSMVMTDAAGKAAELHSRMPVLLQPEDYATYVTGTPAEAFSLCKPWAGDLVIERTDQSWAARR